MKKIHIVTLGCSKNVVDSENLATKLKKAGAQVSFEQNHHNARTVVINTCGFIADAKEESIETILNWAQAKKQGKIDRLFVMGCLAQRYKAELEGEIPEVDAFFGVSQQPQILQALNLPFGEKQAPERLISTPPHYAYLKISEGCDRSCSFCAIPLIRGKHHSIPVETLEAQARWLVSQGVKELILIAQDSTYYGIDLYGKQELARLLDRLAQIPQLRWLRLHYAYPAKFPLEILPLIRQRKTICPYLDIPFQHISDPILKKMRRGHTQKQTYELIETIRDQVPGIALRTTLLTGFPGETQADFDQLMKFVEKVRFERLGVFAYSEEEGTTAARDFRDSISHEVKQKRCEQIMALQQDIALQKNQALVGKSIPVLIDRAESDFFVGRSPYDSPEVDNEILIDKNTHPNLVPGNFYTLKIRSAQAFELFV